MRGILLFQFQSGFSAGAESRRGQPGCSLLPAGLSALVSVTAVAAFLRAKRGFRPHPHEKHKRMTCQALPVPYGSRRICSDAETPGWSWQTRAAHPWSCFSFFKRLLAKPALRRPAGAGTALHVPAKGAADTSQLQAGVLKTCAKRTFCHFEGGMGLGKWPAYAYSLKQQDARISFADCHTTFFTG